MTIREMTATSIQWMKERSTSIFVRAKNGLYEIEFIRRNKRIIAFSLLIWLLSCAAGYLILRNAVGSLKDDFYRHGTLSAEKLATRTGPLLLEKDVLALSLAIGDVADIDGLVFAAIVDHEDRIAAHTDAELLNTTFKPMTNSRLLATIDQVAIEEFVSGSRIAISFSLDVTYAGIKIGKAYFATDANPLYNSVNRYKRLYISWLVLSVLLLAVILLAVDRAYMAIAKKRQKDMEGVTQMGPYLLRQKLAIGGMAELFLADYIREDDFKKIVAVKRVLPHLAASPEFTKMFVREARLAALLQHPNIVQIIDFGKIHDIYFIAMEYIHGKNLGEIMATVKEGLSLDQSVFIASKVCLGLQYSHSKRDDQSGEQLDIVHRDISPQNILVSFQGEVKISDFGISKSRTEPSLTRTGIIKGKLSYLAPEQALGETVDHRTDIFAFGIVFYEILSGRRLFKFADDIQAVRSIPEMDITPIRELRPDIPDELNSIVMKCLEKDKDLRYQSAQEVLVDLIYLRQNFNMTYDESSLSEFMNREFSEEDTSQMNPD